MKKILLYTTAMLALTFGSCQQESDLIFKGGGSDSFSLKVEIDNIGTGMQTDTRAIIVDPVAGEEKVAGLHLLFFDASSDGSGKFKHSVQINNGNEITTGTNFAVNFEGANSGNYSILAFANAEEYFLDSPTGSLQNFLDGLDENMTETDVINSTMLYTGSSISIDKLIMSGYTDKNEGVQLVTLKLTRGVVRFDIQNLDSDYNLVSAAVYNKASYTPLWLSTSNASIKPPVTAGKFYDVAPASGAQSIRGGLYTLENYVSNPKTGDNSTTAIVVGLEKGGITHFYRVNINPEESGQSLKRNYVYQLTVRKVLGDGEISSDDAASTSTDPNLDYDINNWNLDDEGLIVTDGKNTLAIPSKIIRFAQEGGERSYTIFTDGEGTLAMTQSLPNGLSASLSGNTLTVTAQDLGTLSRRDGTLKISFAGLQGEVQVIQEPKIAHFLRLDQTSLRGFSADSNEATTQYITVNSSAEWTAKVYNTGGSHFVIDGNAEGQSGQTLGIKVNADNETNKVLTGFVLVSLKDIPGYSRVVMLKQAPLGGISIDFGSLTALAFEVNGAPKAIHGATSGDVYEFLVDPGMDSETETPNPWNAILEGDNANKFKLVVEKEQVDGINRVIVYPWNESVTGNLRYFNLSSSEISGVTLKVYSGSNPDVTDPRLMTTIPVSQDALVFDVVTTSISKKGGERLVQIDMSEGLTWTATIEENKAYDAADADRYAESALGHPKGYIVDDDTKLSNVGAKLSKQTDNSLKVGFNKLLFPQVNITPTLKIKIQIDGVDDAAAEANGLTKTIDVLQEKLLPAPVVITDAIGGTNWGTLTDTGHFGAYITFLTSSLFSPNSSYFYLPSPISIPADKFDGSKVTAATQPGTNYMHAGNRKDDWVLNSYSTLSNWLDTDKERIMVFVQDTDANGPAFMNDNSPLKKRKYVAGSTSSDTRITSDDGSVIANFIFRDGPFGKVGDYPVSLTGFGRIDSRHTTVTKSSLPKGAVALITNTGANADNVLVAIDPVGKLVFMGECQLFDSDGYSINLTNPMDKFLANLQAYILYAAQYGTHFVDHFSPGSTTYPFPVKDPMIP